MRIKDKEYIYLSYFRQLSIVSSPLICPTNTHTHTSFFFAHLKPSKHTLVLYVLTRVAGSRESSRFLEVEWSSWCKRVGERARWWCGSLPSSSAYDYRVLLTPRRFLHFAKLPNVCSGIINSKPNNTIHFVCLQSRDK